MRSKPLIHSSNTLIVRSDESFDLLLRQVGAIPGMVRVANLIQMFLQDFKVGLGETNSKVNNVVSRGRELLDPTLGVRNALFDSVCAEVRCGGGRYDRCDYQ